MAEKTELELIANRLRKEHVARNEYNYTDEYGVNNKNALSDGDEKGKGQMGDDGTIGSVTDINTRIANIVKNNYNKNNGYGLGHPNAISDGDEKGKGLAGDGGTIGSLTDINTRKENLVKNPIYGPNKKQYPDFEF